MTSPLGQMPKPDAERFRKGRKVYLVPLFVGSSEMLPGLDEKLVQYWQDAQAHIGRLEASLGPVSQIYHETVYLSGDEGEKIVEELNPAGYRLVHTWCQGGAHLEATEDMALVAESSDWQRCLSIGLASEKVSSMALQGYLEVTSQRYGYIANRIDETLKEDQSAIVVIGDNHRVQFPQDIQVFYIAPPALNDLRRWIEDRVQQRAQPQE